MNNQSRTTTLHSRRSRTADEAWWYLPSVAVSSFMFAAFFVAVGLYFGSYQQSHRYVEKFRSALNEHRSLIDGTRVEVRADLDALTQRIGLLQAHVTRINALGTKVVAMAGLKENEFDFSSVPPMGGADESLDHAGYGDEEITRVMERLELALLEKEQQLNILDELMLAKDLQEEIKPSGMPVDQGWMSSKYGYRNDPFTGKRQFHSGIDFAATQGTSIFSAASGVVTKVTNKADYGLSVEVDHRNGYVTHYAHVLEVLVKKGDIVKQGQGIAKVGNTGRSTGPHLHFEVIKNGKTINPSKLLEPKKG